MRPKVKTRCVASRYDGTSDRTIEFSSECGGGLINFRVAYGKLRVVVFNHDKNVIVKQGRRSGMK